MFMMFILVFLVLRNRSGGARARGGSNDPRGARARGGGPLGPCVLSVRTPRGVSRGGTLHNVQVHYNYRGSARVDHKRRGASRHGLCDRD